MKQEDDPNVIIAEAFLDALLEDPEIPLSPAEIAAFEALEAEHGKGKDGSEAGFVIAMLLAQTDYFDSADVSDGSAEPISDEHRLAALGGAGGSLVKALCRAIETGNGEFFRVLADMAEGGFQEGPNRYTQSGFAMRARATLQLKGEPVTKKSVREAAESQRARWSLENRGIAATAERILREIAKSTWNWKRLWRSHPKLEDLPNDRGGRPPAGKQGT